MWWNREFRDELYEAPPHSSPAFLLTITWYWVVWWNREFRDDLYEAPPLSTQAVHLTCVWWNRGFRAHSEHRFPAPKDVVNQCLEFGFRDEL